LNELARLGDGLLGETILIRLANIIGIVFIVFSVVQCETNYTVGGCRYITVSR